MFASYGIDIRKEPILVYPTLHYQNGGLDIIVFGRTAGKNAAARSKDVTVGALTLEHIARFDAQRAAAGIETDAVSPKLLPDYRHTK